MCKKESGKISKPSSRGSWEYCGINRDNSHREPVDKHLRSVNWILLRPLEMTLCPIKDWSASVSVCCLLYCMAFLEHRCILTLCAECKAVFAFSLSFSVIFLCMRSFHFGPALFLSPLTNKHTHDHGNWLALHSFAASFCTS